MAGPERSAPHPLGHAASDAATDPQLRSPYGRHGKVNQEDVWPKAIHRVATGELTAEQAVDEAVARIKQFLAE